MNRDYYNSLSEAYQAMQEEKGSFQQGRDSTKGKEGEGVGKFIKDAGKRTAKAGQAYTQGLFTGKKVASKAAPEMRATNAIGRLGSYGGKNFARTAKGAYEVGKAAYNTGKALGDKLKDPVAKGAGWLSKQGQGLWRGLTKEEVEALLNSPHLTEEEREAFIAMIDEERKDEKGMTPDEKSIGRSIKAGMNPLSDHMAAATRQRLHLAQRGKKKPTAQSKETRLPAQQLKDRKANDGVKEFGEELLKNLAAELMEGGFGGFTDEELAKAASAVQKRHKEQGWKSHSTNSMKDVIDRVTARKKGQV